MKEYEKDNLKTQWMISILFMVTTCILFPFELYISNCKDLNIYIGSFLVYILILLVAVLIVTGVLTFVCYKGKGRTLITSCFVLLFGITVAAYLQGTYLNINLGTMDGTTIFWENYKKHAIFNTLIWIALIHFPFVLKKWKGEAFRNKVVRVLSGFLICIQAVAVITLCFTADFSDTMDANKKALYSEDIYQLSPKQNVVVLLLDCFDTELVDEIKKEEPDFFDSFSGFTYYDNMTSRYFRTSPSITYLMTGEPYQDDIPTSEYLNQAWDNSPFISRLLENNYQINLYSGSPLVGQDRLNQISNYKKETVSIRGEIEGMTQMELYRVVPHVLKPSFWFYTDDVEKKIKGNQGNIYTTNDWQFYTDLKKQGLRIDSEKNNFVFYHLQGAHIPYDLTRNIEFTAQETSRLDRAIATMKIVKSYIEEMKQEGVFEQSTVIITADHGKVPFDEDATELTEVTRPLFMIKSAGQSAGEPMKTMHVQASQDDFGATILDSIGLPYEDVGSSLFDRKETDQIERTYYFTARENGKEKSLIEYKITGDASDFNNWKKTGNDTPVKYSFYSTK